MMEELSEQQREILLFVHQSQHEESLQHRRSILNAFSLSMTGLMAIMAGAIAIGHMSVNLTFPIPVNCIEAKTELKSTFMVCIAYRNIVTNLARRCCVWSQIQEQREA